MRRLQLEDVFEKRPICMLQPSACQEIKAERFIDLKTQQPWFQESLVFAGKGKHVRGIDIIKRLHPYPIPGAEQLLFCRIIKRESPHPIETLQAIQTPMPVGVD